MLVATKTTGSTIGDHFCLLDKFGMLKSWEDWMLFKWNVYNDSKMLFKWNKDSLEIYLLDTKYTIIHKLSTSHHNIDLIQYEIKQYSH